MVKVFNIPNANVIREFPGRVVFSLDVFNYSKKDNSKNEKAC